MGLKILVLGVVPAEVLDQLRSLDGGSEVLGPADAATLVERLGAERPDVVVTHEKWRFRGSPEHPFLQVLDNEYARAVRYRHPIAVLSVGADRLAALAQAHGDAAVETYVVQLEETLRRSLRQMDLLARIGPNELCVVLPETSASGAASVADRVRGLASRLLVKAASGSGKSLPVKTTCSIGYADAPAEGVVTSRDLLERARRAREKAREEGGDRASA